MPSEPDSPVRPPPAPETTPTPRSPGRLIALVLMAGFLPALWILNAWTPRPRNLGVRNGLLAACPDSPNCVNSQQHADELHGIPPLAFRDTPAEAKARLKAVIGRQPRTKLVQETSDYLRYEFRTRFCYFVDDVEFHVDGIAKVVHVRSASRLGHSDLGTNRRRIEALRAQFEPPRPPPAAAPQGD